MIHKENKSNIKTNTVKLTEKNKTNAGLKQNRSGFHSA